MSRGVPAPLPPTLRPTCRGPGGQGLHAALLPLTPRLTAARIPPTRGPNCQGPCRRQGLPALRYHLPYAPPAGGQVVKVFMRHSYPLLHAHLLAGAPPAEGHAVVKVYLLHAHLLLYSPHPATIRPSHPLGPSTRVRSSPHLHLTNQMSSMLLPHGHVTAADTTR